MCGIFGIYLSDSQHALDQGTLKTIGDSLRHRGPDDEGFYLDGPFGFGMRRLSIIDLDTGHQPIHNEDCSLQVVFNGEIYNYRELTRNLTARGHMFYTTSDTEVIPHLFEEYGEDCVRYLRGMFAFALWHAKTRTLLLARDRLGIKPLYYARTPSAFIFGSELKSILRYPGLDRQIDLEALLVYLQYGYVPDPLSILRGVRKLAPGHTLIVREGRILRERSYWDLRERFRAPDHDRSLAEWQEELRWRLTESVRLHLVSDVPVGAFLSGGIDSTTVVALMAAQVDHPIKTFSVGFEEKPFNELPYARLASRRFATEHHEIIVGRESVDSIDRVVGQFDEPFADASALPTYILSKLAREHVKVVLSGDGGDELFAGYDRYVVDHRRRRYDILSQLRLSGLLRRIGAALPETTPGKNYLLNITLPRMARYLDSISHHRPYILQHLLSPSVAQLDLTCSDVFARHITATGDLDFLSRLQYLDLKTYLAGDILAKVDRMSMIHSLEARVPLLDHELVEFLASVPASYRLQGQETKYLLKRAMQDLVPPEILARKKQGFAVPIEHWFRDDLRDYLRQQLLGHQERGHGLFNRSSLAALFEAYTRTGRPDLLGRLWTLLVFEVWYRGAVAA